MTSSWRHVLTVRPPKTAPWWPLAAASCFPRVRRDFTVRCTLNSVYMLWCWKKGPDLYIYTFLGVYRAPERSCPTASDHYSAPSVRCREPPFTQHPSHMPLERFLQSAEAQSSNASAGSRTPLCFFSQKYGRHLKICDISTANFMYFTGILCDWVGWLFHLILISSCLGFLPLKWIPVVNLIYTRAVSEQMKMWMIDVDFLRCFSIVLCL